jgi:ArsR family transcriptional regulator, cadmium/lead-responsive transcriptional repressor
MSPGSPDTRRPTSPSGEDEQLWEAVADPSRRKVLDLILAHGQATPTILAAELPVTRQAVTKHLAVLARAGLVETRRQGREAIYTVRPDRVAAAAQAMAQSAQAMAAAAARWDRRLSAIKRLAEAQASTTTTQSPPQR